MGSEPEKHIGKMMGSANIGMVVHKFDSAIVYANSAALSLLRLSHQQIIGKDAMDPQWHFVDEHNKPLPLEKYPVMQVIQSGQRLEDFVLGVVDGSVNHITWLVVNAHIEGEGDDSQRFIVVTFYETSYKFKPFSMEEIIENATDIISVCEFNDKNPNKLPRLVYVNQAYEMCLNYNRQDALGKVPGFLRDNDDLWQRIRSALQQNIALTEETLEYQLGEHAFWVEVSIFPLTGKGGKVTHFACIERDISLAKQEKASLEQEFKNVSDQNTTLAEIIEEKTRALKDANAALEKMAYTDPLTALPNRRLFSLQLDKLLHAAERRNELLAFGIIDADDFKALNDRFGHDVGDITLKHIAQALRQSFRADGILCRYGGEEFAFAFAAKELEDISTCCERLLSNIHGIDIQTADGNLRVTVSIGVCVVSQLGQITERKIYRVADRLMYRAKRQGKDRYIMETAEL
ncbi:diguanylate cyclase [Bowmanella sp. JS7-9]|uniref:Diguanylate cyclase n=1 Tax=Pseudobowmanella zhangzhouensis TaxID=1537679 RepID=A0ABW1XK58_9ALTE|nr:diguanylate cyclase [Bowmanella sp. JS7-9]TBX23129.1 hypothetical protein TK45_07930 [Bowmanella sp. JS7-9]